MCGVVGSVSLKASQEPRIGILAHRGPDSSGVRSVSLSWGYVDFGCTRLSIVGDDAVPVPGYFQDVTLTFCGEIYNWRELRSELSDGTPWETNCDTEVVARAWRRWGPDMLSRFNGMFAFALVDPKTNQVLLARDRAGEKPLFYAVHEGALFFSSEIKALSVPLIPTPEACPELDVLEFDCLDRTPFQGVSRLGPGQYILINNPDDLQNPQPKTWWALPSEVDEDMSWDRAVAETEATLVDAIMIRASADVQMTALVSGGLDSAIVQAVARFPEVLCCSFPNDAMDWMPDARLAAQGAVVVPVTFGLPEALRDLEQVAYHLDTPATWTALCQWFLAREIKARGYKVVLTGEGSDELFGGYSRYRILWWLSQARQDPQLRNYQPLLNVTIGQDEMTLANLLDRSPGHRSIAHALTLVRRFTTGKDLPADMARVEWHTTMQCLLRMADRMMASQGLENRSPFFDYRVIELATRIPTRHKITPTWSKAVLRAVALRLGVPKAIVDNPNKVGLVVPWNKWRAATTEGGRGAWDRGDFREQMNKAWLQAFQGGTNACSDHGRGGVHREQSGTCACRQRG